MYIALELYIIQCQIHTYIDNIIFVSAYMKVRPKWLSKVYTQFTNTWNHNDVQSGGQISAILYLYHKLAFRQGRLIKVVSKICLAMIGM